MFCNFLLDLCILYSEFFDEEHFFLDIEKDLDVLVLHRL